MSDSLFATCQAGETSSARMIGRALRDSEKASPGFEQALLDCSVVALGSERVLLGSEEVLLDSVRERPDCSVAGLVFEWALPGFAKGQLGYSVASPGFEEALLDCSVEALGSERALLGFESGPLDWGHLELGPALGLASLALREVYPLALRRSTTQTAESRLPKSSRGRFGHAVEP